MSPIQKPGQVTQGMTPKCKHIGTLPPTGMISSRDCGVVHRGKIDEHCMLMYDEKHALYISSDVFPTFEAYVFGKPSMMPSNIESVTSAIAKSAIVIGYKTAPKQLCPVTI